jgi:hypothetical protein
MRTDLVSLVRRGGSKLALLTRGELSQITVVVTLPVGGLASSQPVGGPCQRFGLTSDGGDTTHIL